MATLPRPIRPAAVAPVPEPVPQRNDRENFAVRGDTVLGWLPGGMAGVNTNIGYQKDALDYLDQEVAAVEANVSASEELLALTTEQAETAVFLNNYKGHWATLAALAGPLNKPASVWQGGSFWALENNLANVALSEPGMTNDWTRVPGVTEVATPINALPAGGAVNVGALSAIVLSANLFGSIYVGDTHASSQWQMHTSLAFAFPMYDSGEVTASTSHTLVFGVAAVSTTYYWRVRYKSSRGTWSAWSRASSFTTAPAFNSYVPTPTPTPAIGAALEGGYYGGMVWHQRTTSATSRTLGTGTVTFQLPVSMHVTPLFYAGQSIEVRSTANPTNRFAGTVTGASGFTLTVNVTAIAGAGTFADWSVMVRYRIIVAPKASGETSSLQWKNATTAGPAGARTVVEGWLATTAMTAAGNASVYPQAHWARGLSIGGYTDWYVPARDEFDVVWRNLKPNNLSNSIAARNTGQGNYTTLGAFADATTENGANLNSSPQGAAYTPSVPTTTAVASFAGAGSEALQSLSTAGSGYWTSTEGSDSNVVFVETNHSNVGKQTVLTKTFASGTNFVRAVRRSMI